MKHIVSPDQFKEMGAEIMHWYDVDAASFDQRWPSFFAASPLLLATVWDRLAPITEEEENGLEAHHLLWAILFLTQYTNKKDLVSKCGGVHEDTYRKYLWVMIGLLASLEFDVIIFKNCKMGDTGENC